MKAVGDDRHRGVGMVAEEHSQGPSLVGRAVHLPGQIFDGGIGHAARPQDPGGHFGFRQGRPGFGLRRQGDVRQQHPVGASGPDQRRRRERSAFRPAAQDHDVIGVRRRFRHVEKPGDRGQPPTPDEKHDDEDGEQGPEGPEGSPNQVTSRSGRTEKPVASRAQTAIDRKML